MKTMSFDGSLKITLAVLFLPVLLSCRSESSHADLVAPENIPLEEFVIGRWLYEGDVYYENLGYRKVHSDYWFEDGNVFKVYAGDVTTCKYEFIDFNKISIDCRPRILEPWIIKVERDGQSLVVHRSDEETLRFEHIDPDTIHRDE